VNDVVLDASALLAVLRAEPGAARVEHAAKAPASAR
jgi:PIN domain nuclease of toxin-antitoxin system